jgi:hypothetical protein
VGTWGVVSVANYVVGTLVSKGVIS